MRDALAVLAAFLAGSIPFGLILVRMTKGIDVRAVGSGNIGATNALRAAGPVVGVLVLVLDALKGAIGIVAGRAIASPASPALEGALVAAAVAGHVFTPWLRFKGGKGVATALGVLAVAEPRVMLCALGVFVLVVLPSRMVSLGSVCAALGVAVAGFALHPGEPLAWGLAVAALLVIVRHRENLRRILSGTESRLGRKSAAPSGSR